MKVQGPQRPGLHPLRDTSVAKDSPEPKAEAARGERVQVSSSSKLLAQAKGPETADSAKVERLRDAIKDGSFKVDAERIADAMIKEELA